MGLQIDVFPREIVWIAIVVQLYTFLISNNRFFYKIFWIFYCWSLDYYYLISRFTLVIVNSAQFDNCNNRGFFLYQFAHTKCVQIWCYEKGDTICEICNQVACWTLYINMIYLVLKSIYIVIDMYLSWILGIVYFKEFCVDFLVAVYGVGVCGIHPEYW